MLLIFYNFIIKIIFNILILLHSAIFGKYNDHFTLKILSVIWRRLSPYGKFEATVIYAVAHGRENRRMRGYEDTELIIGNCKWN